MKTLATVLSLLMLCCALTACGGYTWRGQEGSHSQDSVLGNGTKTLRIKSVDQTTLYSWLPYAIRSQLRDDITERGLARWVDSGSADYTITVKVHTFQIIGMGQSGNVNQLFTATINMEFIVYNGATNTVSWQSGPVFQSENFETNNEEEAIRELVTLGIRRGLDRMQQRF